MPNLTPIWLVTVVSTVSAVLILDDILHHFECIKTSNLLAYTLRVLLVLGCPSGKCRMCRVYRITNWIDHAGDHCFWQNALHIAYGINCLLTYWKRSSTTCYYYVTLWKTVMPFPYQLVQDFFQTGITSLRFPSPPTQGLFHHLNSTGLTVHNLPRKKATNWPENRDQPSIFCDGSPKMCLETWG